MDNTIQDISTDIGKVFIEKLSYLLKYLNPPFVDKEKINITCKIENNEEHITVHLPHKTKRILDLFIYYYKIESTVEIANAWFHYREYESDITVRYRMNIITKLN